MPDRLKTLIEGSATIREAAAEFGVGYSTVRYWIKRLGLEPARGPATEKPQQAAEATE